NAANKMIFGSGTRLTVEASK
uniref:Uncharacterized protein n=1 Tax=Stegastes partitus TaxID=144197 RepID=A0A3B4ZLU5_9TELE